MNTSAACMRLLASGCLALAARVARSETGGWLLEWRQTDGHGYRFPLRGVGTYYLTNGSVTLSVLLSMPGVSRCILFGGGGWPRECGRFCPALTMLNADCMQFFYPVVHLLYIDYTSQDFIIVPTKSCARWPRSTVPDLRPRGRVFESHTWLLCTNANFTYIRLL